MYSITFGVLNGEPVSFDKITEIRVGGSMSSLKTIDENEILNYVFSTECVYQLIGENFNTIFCFNYEKTGYISVRKTSD